MRISLRNLTKRLGDRTILDQVSLEIREHELFFLLGPSGCGKTTLLRLLAGFYEPDQGEIYFGETRMNDVPAHQRNTGLVFQNYALWPHLKVRENVAYGLETRKIPEAEKRQRVAEALAIVRMEDFADAAPNQLSGGQQQRVALARALVVRPDVLLLDEPLSNLDARLRLEMREEIRRIHAETRHTTIYVTHDQKEALSLADRLAVVHNGRIDQVGDPRTLYRHPTTRFVADFLGETNWIEGTVVRQEPSGVTLATPLGTIRASASCASKPGKKVQVGFRPESAKIRTAQENCFRAIVFQVTFFGEMEQYVVETKDQMRFLVCEQDPVCSRSSGTEMDLYLPPESLILLEGE